MQLKTIPQEKAVLPRINKQFIGIGHELENKRKSRRKIQQQQRLIENRVNHLEKQDLKAQKDLKNKRNQLEKLLNIKERQQQESRQRFKQQQREQLQRLRKQSQYMRMLHRHNLSNSIQNLKNINHNDYSRIKIQRVDGEYRKKKNLQEDLKQKQNQWKSSNFQKQVGKAKINQFYKQRNRQHLLQYNSRILKQDRKMQSKMDSMKQLIEKEQYLKQKLQQSCMKNSKVAELINHIAKTTSSANSRITETIDHSALQQFRKKQESRKTVNSQRKSATIRLRSHANQQIEQNIFNIRQEDKRQIYKALKKRKKNRHINRYKQYEAY